MKNRILVVTLIGLLLIPLYAEEILKIKLPIKTVKILNEGNAVYVNYQEKTFHLHDCPHLTTNYTGMALSYAAEKKYQPCPFCILSKEIPVMSTFIDTEILGKKRVFDLRNEVDLGLIKIRVIKTEKSKNFLTVKIMIRNISNQNIKNCQLTGILFDGNSEVDVESHYVISSTEGGLNTNDFTFFEYIFSVEQLKYNAIGFKIKSIDYK